MQDDAQKALSAFIHVHVISEDGSKDVVTLYVEERGHIEQIRSVMRAATSQRRTLLIRSPYKFAANVVKHLLSRMSDLVELYSGAAPPRTLKRFAWWHYDVFLGPPYPRIRAVCEANGEVIYDGPLNKFLGTDMRRRPYTPPSLDQPARLMRRAATREDRGAVDFDYVDRIEGHPVWRDKRESWPKDPEGSGYEVYPEMWHRFAVADAMGIKYPGCRPKRSCPPELLQPAYLEELDRRGLLPPVADPLKGYKPGRRVLRLDFSRVPGHQVDQDDDSEEARELDDAVRQ